MSVYHDVLVLAKCIEDLYPEKSKHEIATVIKKWLDEGADLVPQFSNDKLGLSFFRQRLFYLLNENQIIN